MIHIYAIMGILVTIGGFAVWAYFRIKRVGENEAELDHAKRGIERQKDEADRIASRPRSVSDIVDRLQKWGRNR